MKQHVDELEDRTDALRKDVTELQIKTGIRPPSSGTYTPVTGKLTSSRQVRAEYAKGRALFVRGDFQGAASIFQSILAGFPGDRLAPNAGYWLGECHYSQGRYNEAITEFERVARTYPSSHKAPDSMLKIAYSHHHLGDGASAMTALRDLLDRYPKSRAAGRVRSGRTIFKNNR